VVGFISDQRLSALHDQIKLYKQLHDNYLDTLRAMSAALDMRDHETLGHSDRVSIISYKIAKKMGLEGEALKQVKWGALLHDIGKIGVPDYILNKPGKLTKQEWEIMRRHPSIGYSTLKDIKFLSPAMDIVYCHHERFDGRGYPNGLSQENIPLSARIFALADTFDAMTNNRPYRKALSKKQAIDEILSQSGKQFDPKVVLAFEKIIRNY
jgi:putative nucleotidyltransferase with HDIG domain